MMARSLAVTIILAAVLSAGCAAPAAAKKRAATRPAAQAPGEQGQAISRTDPCANRLHELSGPLLLYFATNHRLPPSLSEIATPAELVCPISHKPYQYNAEGIPVVGGGYAVVYDAAPSHNGRRLAIVIAEPVPDQPLLTKVLLLPDAQFPPMR